MCVGMPTVCGARGIEGRDVARTMTGTETRIGTQAGREAVMPGFGNHECLPDKAACRLRLSTVNAEEEG